MAIQALNITKRFGDFVALDHEGCRTAPTEEVGDGDADGAAAADDDAFGPTHPATVPARQASA